MLAEVVLVAHFGFIIFALFGGLLAFRFRLAPLLHVPAVVWGAFVEVTGRVCPLTPLENALRRAAGDMGYSGGFIERYLVPVVYPEALSPGVQLSLAAGLVLVNVAVYGLVLRRRVSVRSG